MTEIIITPALFAAVTFCFWTLVTQWSRHARLKQFIDFRLRVFERLASVDGGGVLGGENGERVIAALMAEAPDGGLPERVLATGRSSLVSLSLGAGLGLLSWRDALDAQAGFFTAAVIVLALGVGLGLSALMSWRLGGRWGLMRPRAGSPDLRGVGPTDGA